MNRLLAVGFETAGHWKPKGDGLTFELFRHASQRNILYAFVSDGTVMYVGKTVQSLQARMGGYRAPATSQTTNVKNNARIKALLQAGAAVDILALPDNGLLHYGQFHINLAAGLEDNIISVLRPEWNGGKSSSPADESPFAIPPETPSATVSFVLVVQKTYFNQGFFNVGIADSDRFGGDGAKIELFCGNAEAPILGTINRTANSNKTPRIMGGTGLRDWFHHEMREMQEATIDMLSSTAIRVRPRAAALTPVAPAV
jgi:hypothetical protein